MATHQQMTRLGMMDQLLQEANALLKAAAALHDVFRTEGAMPEAARRRGRPPKTQEPVAALTPASPGRKKATPIPSKPAPTVTERGRKRRAQSMKARWAKAKKAGVNLVTGQPLKTTAMA